MLNYKALDFLRAGDKAGNNRAPQQLSYSRLMLARSEPTLRRILHALAILSDRGA